MISLLGPILCCVMWGTPHQILISSSSALTVRNQVVLFFVFVFVFKYLPGFLPPGNVHRNTTFGIQSWAILCISPSRRISRHFYFLNNTLTTSLSIRSLFGTERFISPSSAFHPSHGSFYGLPGFLLPSGVHCNATFRVLFWARVLAIGFDGDRSEEQHSNNRFYTVLRWDLVLPTQQCSRFSNGNHCKDFKHILLAT